MRNSCLWLLVLVVMLAPAQAQGIRVILNDREMFFDQPPAMIDGRLMVPLRGIFEGLSADVLYTASTRSIKATKGPTIVELTLGRREGFINGRPVYLDVPADTVGGRTMVPLRFVSEALGAEVKWDGANRTVRIADQSASVPEPPPDPPPAEGAPHIDQVTHNANRPLQPGDVLDVVLVGDPDAEASFQILGVTEDIPMREVRSGRYEGSFTVPRGTTVQQGVLAGRLARNGREAMAESNRPVTIRGASGPSGGVTITGRFPAENSSVSEARPQIGVQTGGPRGRVERFLVDDLDVTAEVRQQGNRVTWTPTYDLSPGTHTVSVVINARDGSPARADWSFGVQAAGLSVAQLFPPANSTSNSTRPVIGAELTGVTGNPLNARLIVDKLDVTAQAQQQGNQVLWTPDFDLAPGPHSVRLVVGEGGGRPPVRANWSFTVAPSSSGPGLRISRLIPAANSTTNLDRPPIGVELAGAQGNVNARLLVDNLDVTQETRRLGNQVVWTPSYSLAPGVHSVEVIIAQGGGRPPLRATWTFFVQ